MCFLSPSHLLYTPKSSKYIQGHTDHELSLYALWEKRYLTYRTVDYGDCKASWLQQFSGAPLFPSVFTVCVTVVGVGFCYSSLYIFSLFLFFEYSRCCSLNSSKVVGLMGCLYCFAFSSAPSATLGLQVLQANNNQSEKKSSTWCFLQWYELPNFITSEM